MKQFSLSHVGRCAAITAMTLGLYCESAVVAAHEQVTISGSPTTSLSVGQHYQFIPSVSPKDQYAHFRIANKPAWASFDPSSGKLSGTPASAADFTNIRIGVHEMHQLVWLPAFSIKVTAPNGSGGSGSPTSQPTITGKPPTSVKEFSTYTFTPAVQGTGSSQPKFAVTNKPAWASFSSSTGTLMGQPTDADVGNYANITISVSVGGAKASLPPFSITVDQTSNGSAQLSWSPPTQNTDGSVITNLAGYKINYGTSRSDLSQTIQVPNPGLSSYVLTGLTTGTWYFDVVAYNSNGGQSSASGIVTKSIQ